MAGWWLALCAPAGAADLLVGPTQSYTTISEAFADAASGDRLLLDPGIYVDGLVLDSIDLEIVGGPGVVVSAVPAAQWMFKVLGGASLTLTEVELDGLGAAAAAWVDASTLFGTDLVLTGMGGVDGGALLATGGAVLRLDGGAVTGASGQLGGVLYASDSAVEFAEVDIADAAAATGGVAVVNGGSLHVDGGAWTNAFATSSGVLSASAATVTLVNLTVSGGSSLQGPLITAYGGELSIVSSRLEANAPAGSLLYPTGGAVFELRDTRVIGNVASDALIYLVNVPDGQIGGNVVCGNTAPYRLLKYSSSSGRFSNNVVMSNTVTGGVGLSAYGATAVVEVANNHFVANTSTSSGSAMASEADGVLNAVNNLVAYERNGQGAAIVGGTAGTLSFRYGLVYDNLPDHISAGTLEQSLVDVEPGFSAPADGDCGVYDIVPSGSSPVIDAGDPSIADVDGTTSDIGAFGGTEPNTLIDWPDHDGDGYTEDRDCDDADESVHPEAEELCNGVDDDCDDQIDEEAPTVTVWVDADSDGFGAGEPSNVCAPLPGTADNADDCDDGDAAIHPAASEACNTVDDDCDGSIDEGLLIEAFVDADLDGFGAGDRVAVCALTPGFVPVAGDCDDTQATVRPGAREARDDGIDQDCDGADLVTRLDGPAGWGCSASGTSGLPWLAVYAVVLVGRRARTARTACTDSEFPTSL